MIKGRIFDIQRASFVDGPGMRTAVFFKGCNLDCKWCHNPESKSPEVQTLFYKDRCSGCGTCKLVCANTGDKCVLCGKCARYCPNQAKTTCGADYSVEQVLCEIKKDVEFYKSTGGGVTFTGGECMLQVDFLKEVLKECKQLGIHTAVDTAGNVAFSKFEKILPYTDMFLYDVKCFTEQLHIEGTGASNKLIKENLERLSNVFKGDIEIRIPVIGGFNDSLEEMIKICEFLKSLKLKNVHLLPYHDMGKSKCEAMGVGFKSYDYPTDIEKYKQMLTNW